MLFDKGGLHFVVQMYNNYFVSLKNPNLTETKKVEKKKFWSVEKNHKTPITREFVLLTWRERQRIKLQWVIIQFRLRTN